LVSRVECLKVQEPELKGYLTTDPGPAVDQGARWSSVQLKTGPGRSWHGDRPEGWSVGCSKRSGSACKWQEDGCYGQLL